MTVDAKVTLATYLMEYEQVDKFEKQQYMFSHKFDYDRYQIWEHLRPITKKFTRLWRWQQ